jgi:ABC-2 type transport system permease protein
MNLWRLEWLRLARTRRLVALVAVYIFFGLTGPITVRYLNNILGRVGTQGVKIELPPPVPADGVAQYINNAAQIGLVVVVLITASALSFDARREMAIFLRTRVDSVARIVIPALTVSAAAAVASFVLGTAAAWYETAVLIGALPVAKMLIGVVYAALFLVFVVCLVAAVAALTRGTLATAGVTLVVLVVMAVLSGLGSLGRWLPTGLASAINSLVKDGRPTDYLPAVGITVVASALLVWLAIVTGSRREL